MTKPHPIAIVALCVVAISILAFTINDELNKRKNFSASSLVASKNVTIPSPFVAYNPPHGQPGHRHDLPDGAPIPNSTPTQNLSIPEPIATSTAAAVNPAHGEPGHRCDIAVGAPLNSTPANTQNAMQAIDVPASGKNPAHGQPGHRCDIAVGAPLNSAPATTATNSATPVVANTASVAPGLNPAHGQPGHRCDIAIGAPLNSAAKTATTTAPSPITPGNATPASPFPSYSFPVNDSTKTAAPQFEYDSTGAALNPAHGQPGHDCSIGIGQPLKKS